MTPSSPKTGYLDSDFKIFHIADRPSAAFAPHYHDFHKIFLFLGGNAGYVVEGRQYDLKPGDVILVEAGEVHRPLLHDSSLYERTILYLSPAFFRQEETSGLFDCFPRGRSGRSSLVRISRPEAFGLPRIFRDLAGAAQSGEFAASLYRRIKVTEFLILLNRALLAEPLGYAQAVTAHPTVLKVMEYINANLTREDLSVDAIAAGCFLTRSYLMHLFKAETGYTIGTYITEKRLFLARGCLSSGMSVTEACYRCGFKNYSSFYYAYRQKYGCSPTAGQTAAPETNWGPGCE